MKDVMRLFAAGIVIWLVWLAIQPRREPMVAGGEGAGPYDAAFFKEQDSNIRTNTWDGILQEDARKPGTWGDFIGSDDTGIAMYAITA
jgi:hypothetical protein